MTRRCSPPSMTVPSGLVRLAASNGSTSVLTVSSFSSIRGKARKTAVCPFLLASAGDGRKHPECTETARTCASDDYHGVSSCG